MTKGRWCNNQSLTGKRQRPAVAGNESERNVAGDGRQKGAVAINKSIVTPTMTGDDESRQQTTKQTEDGEVDRQNN